ncbi:MAG TPA: hypothetical protein VM143_10225 [Acidimicrobiales bacterium]|nr:hypothetical protein [Acidimicrobiales bacterium]
MMLPSLPSRLAAAAVLAVLAIGGAGCSKDGDHASSPSRKSGSTTTAAAGAVPTLHFTVTETNDNGTKAPDEATVAAVRKTLDGWLASAVVAPLHSGGPAPDLTALFTPPALERMSDPATRATLVDEGMPAASKAITADVAQVLLSSVAGPDEVIALIGARIEVKVRAVGPTLDADVVHQGELVLVPEADGTWKIDSFAIHTARDSRP